MMASNVEREANCVFSFKFELKMLLMKLAFIINIILRIAIETTETQKDVSIVCLFAAKINNLSKNKGNL